MTLNEEESEGRQKKKEINSHEAKIREGKDKRRWE